MAARLKFYTSKSQSRYVRTIDAQLYGLVASILPAARRPVTKPILINVHKARDVSAIDGALRFPSIKFRPTYLGVQVCNKRGEI